MALMLHRDLLRTRRSDPVIALQGAGGFDGASLSDHVLMLRWFDDRCGDRLLVVNLGRDVPPEATP